MRLPWWQVRVPSRVTRELWSRFGEGGADVADLGGGRQLRSRDGDAGSLQDLVHEGLGLYVQCAVCGGRDLQRVLDRGAAAVLRLHLHPAQSVLRVQAGADFPAAAPALDVRAPGGQLLGVEVGAQVARRTAPGEVEDVVAVGEQADEGAGLVEGYQVFAVGAVLQGRGRVDLGERGAPQGGQAQCGREAERRGHGARTALPGSPGCPAGAGRRAGGRRCRRRRRRWHRPGRESPRRPVRAAILLGRPVRR